MNTPNIRHTSLVPGLAACVFAFVQQTMHATYVDYSLNDGITIGRNAADTADLVFFHAAEESSPARTVTFFGGYAASHDFVWGTGTYASPTTLMKLHYNGVLDVYSDAASGDYISFDPANSTLHFQSTSSGRQATVQLNTTSGALEVDDGTTTSTLLTQDASGNLNLAAAGVISQDLTVGDATTTTAGLTVEGKLKLEDIDGLDEGTTINATNEDYTYVSDEVTHTVNRDILYADSDAIELQRIRLGNPPGHLHAGYAKNPGLYSYPDTEYSVNLYAYGSHGGGAYYERLFAGAGGVGITGSSFTVAEWPGWHGSQPVLDVVISGKRVGVLTGSAGPQAELHVVGDVKFEDDTNGSSLTAGSLNTAVGKNAHALGLNLNADGYATVVVGMFNDAAPGQSASTRVDTDELFVVGNGTDNANRSNALVITKDGNASFSGEVTMIRQGDIYMGSFSDVTADQAPGS